MKKMIFLVIAGFVFLGLSLSVAADIPMMLNYQGYVEYDNGALFNGNGYFKFAIVDSNGNTTYWSNDVTSTTGGEPDNAVVIPVTNGIFTTKLGNTDFTNMSALPITVFDNQSIYVRVWFSDDGTNFNLLSPDTQIVSAGFAYKAQTVVDSSVTSKIKVESNDIPMIWLNTTATNHKCSKICYFQNGIECFALGYDLWGENADVFTLFDSTPNGGPVLNIRNGNVGIGTTSPVYKLDVEGPTSQLLNLNSTTGSPYLTFEVNGSPKFSLGYRTDVFKLVVGTNLANSHFVMDNSGNVGIGTSNPSYKLHVNGTAYAAGAAGALSDRRYKKNINDISFDALELINNLHPVTFEWKDPQDSGMEGTQLGFIAQEVEEVLPDAVLTQDNEEQTKGLKYNALIPLLTKAIQELKAQNEALKDENNSLRHEIEQIKEAIGL